MGCNSEKGGKHRLKGHPMTLFARAFRNATFSKVIFSDGKMFSVRPGASKQFSYTAPFLCISASKSFRVLD